MSLTAFMSNQALGLTPVAASLPYTPTKDAIIAVAIIPNSVMPASLSGPWGTPFVFPAPYVRLGGAAPATEPLTARNVVDALRQLAFSSQIHVFPHGTIANGMKGKPTPSKQTEKFGVFPIERETGEITERVEFRAANYHQNIPFFNSLRNNPTGFQVVLFLNNAVIWVGTDATPVFHDMGQGFSGDANNVITAGDVMVTWQCTGELPIMPGTNFSHLDETNFRLTFAAPSAPSAGLTTELTGGQNIVIRCAVAGGNVTRAVAQAAFTTGLTYSGQILSGPSQTGITISPLGVVTIAAANPVGTYRFRVFAQNASSIAGVYDATVILT